MFDKNLVHAIIGGKDPDRGSAELSLNLVLTRGHGSLLLDLWYFRGTGHPGPTRSDRVLFALWFDSDSVIHGRPNPPFAAQVSLRRLDRDVAEQALYLCLA